MKAWFLRILLLCSVFLTGCDRYWSDADIEATKEAGNQIVEALDTHRLKHGNYPGKLDELVKSGSLEAIPEPVGKQRTWEYSVQGDRTSCRLTVRDREGKLPHSLDWTSGSGTWVLDFE
ncbi:MAG: hypothetical protein EOP88_02575 [Verrucomicrobiaceae bacterium]|nr:MAG: hypothetical protein EOP88_02575 [Verrucomicrobiaceae bacterium]